MSRAQFALEGELDRDFSSVMSSQMVSSSFHSRFISQQSNNTFFKVHSSSSTTIIRVPTAQGKQGKWKKKSLSGKTQQIWKFCQNIGKMQEIWFAQVVNSLILKVKDISIFVAKISTIFLKLDKSAKSICCI